MSSYVNCRKSNKKSFLRKSNYINTFRKSGIFFLTLCIDFYVFVSYNVLRQKDVGGKNIW